jgi:alpha-L-fucosidase 2
MSWRVFVSTCSLVICLGESMRAETESTFRGTTATQPAARWEECLLTGNGRMGAMVFGRPYDEIVVINHCKLYLPRGSREIVHDLAATMPEFKRAGLAAGKDGPAVVHKMMLEKSGQKIINTDPFHPAFMLRLDMSERAGSFTNYLCTQNFETGELTTRWTDKNGDWERRLFASRPDSVVVMSIAGPKGKVGCELSMEINHALVETEFETVGGQLSAHAAYVKGKGGYDSLLRVVAEGGSIESEDENIKVSGADSVLLLMQVRTWQTPLPKEQSEAWAFSPDHPDYGTDHTTNHLPEMKREIASLSADYDTLLRPHADVHGELFSRVKLSLNAGADRTALSEKLLARAVEDDCMSLALMERMYEACRYLTVCSSGERPSNLQGIWTGTWSPAWSGDYTLDSNLQLEVQSLMSGNMPELMQSYFELVESWLPDCRLNAKKFYGCRGIVSNARASNVCLLLHWGRWPGEQAIGCMGWMAHFFYDYYLFTGDKEFLAKRCVPLLKESVLFYEDLLAGTEDENGKYRFFIGYSPEHGLSANTTFDISIAKAMLTYLIDACEELGIEEDNLPKWKAMLAKMPPYLVNEKGELKEWSWPGVGEGYNQRHHSHFLPLYQFCEFDPETTPGMWKAAGLAFEGKVKGWLHRKKGANSNHITHGMANQGQCAARLGRGEIVWEVLSRMATKRYLYPSFMISYWPGLKGFGFDPVGTLPDVVHNSLIFSWDGTLDILPALPKEWPEGSISGILARGQIEVEELAWDMAAGRAELQLMSGKEQTVKLRIPEGRTIKDAKVTAGGARIDKGKSVNSRVLHLPADESVRLVLQFDKTEVHLPHGTADS